MAEYSATDKFLHRLYLGNPSISRSALELEEIMFGAKAKSVSLAECVFVTGLARSGTTAVMRQIFATGEYASLQYANMPFVLNPNLWNRELKIASHERAHKDGIIIDGNSPEEFDEFFWKAILKDSYIVEDGMQVHELDQNVIDKYITYIKLICLAKQKSKYISKNNNNILRVKDLRKIPNQKVIILFRDPVSHASSLRKLHLRFSKIHEEDPFSLEYFNFLGHHEFGLNHKPFILTQSFEDRRVKYSKEDLNYWLSIWHNYYSYVLEELEQNDILICFEDITSQPEVVYPYLESQLKLDSKLDIPEKHQPGKYGDINCDQHLLQECNDLYENLQKITAYR